MKVNFRYIRNIPHEVFGYDDVTVKINLVCDPVEYGAYYPKSKIIELNVLDENDRILDTDLIIKILCHELAHHIQFLNYTPVCGKEHDEKFNNLLWQLLGMYYEGNIPEHVRKQVLIDQEVSSHDEGVELLYG